MSYYKKLRLPTMPFKDWDQFIASEPERHHKGANYFIAFPAKDHITDETNEILQSLGIVPKHFLIFCPGQSKSSADKRILHADVCWDPIKKNWKPVYCAINWEIGGTNQYYWYDTSALQNQYPLVSTDEAGNTVPHPKYQNQSEILNSIQYGKERNIIGIPAGAVLLDETYLDAPTLVRVEIAHTTSFDHPKKRYGLSLRIDESGVNSWNDVLTLFKPLYE